MQRKGTRLPASLWKEADTEKGNLIRDVQAFSRRSSFAQHGARKIRGASLACRVGCPATPHQQNEVRQRELMLLNYQKLEAIRELPRQNRR